MKNNPEPRPVALKIPPGQMEKEQMTAKLPDNRKKYMRFIVPGYPAFNVYSTVARYTTALGPLLIATAAAQTAGWEVEVIDENNFHGKAPRDSNNHPDHNYLQSLRRADVVLFYGGLSSTIPRVYQLAEFYQRRQAVTVGGGQHFADENIAEGLFHHLDFILTGEGEFAIVELQEALQGKRSITEVKGLAWLESGKPFFNGERSPLSVKEIELLPIADFSLLRHARVKIFPVSWGRGCAMHCEFCAVKSEVRCPDADYLVSQVIALHERFRAMNFFIVDDLFGQKRNSAIEFCRKIKDYQKTIKKKFFLTVQIRLDRAADAELLEAMRGAGIKMLAVGYESPIEEELVAMNKQIRQVDMIRNTKLFHDAGFLIHGMFIFAYPSKPGQEFQMLLADRCRAFVKFINKAKIDTIQILLPVPLPGTELTTRLKSQKRNFPLNNIGWEFYDGNFQLFMPDAPLLASEMQTALASLMRKFYNWRSLIRLYWVLISFPMLLFSFHRLKTAWKKWTRKWRNAIWRFIGWRLVSGWHSGGNQELFLEKLMHTRDLK